MSKRIFLKSMATAVVALATVSAFAQSGQDALERVKKSGVLKVGTETAFAPYDFIDKGEHVGFNVDMYREIVKEMGVKLEWVLLPWEGVFPGLESGKFDIVAGPATVTKERLLRYRFTPPIADSTVALLKRKGDNSLMKASDVGGKAVGVGKASAQLTQIKAYSDTLANKVDVREYPGNNEAYADLAASRLAAVCNTLTNIAYVAQQRPDTFEVVLPPFGVKAYAAFVGRKDADYAKLMDAVQATMLKIKADGRMAAMQKKWFGQTFDTPDMVNSPNL
jgi:polar amino acid transport system substrate-binding protein